MSAQADTNSMGHLQCRVGNTDPSGQNWSNTVMSCRHVKTCWRHFQLSSQQGKYMTFHSSGIRVQDRIYQGYLYPYNPTIQYQIYDLVQHSLSRLESNIQGSNFERMKGITSHDLLPEIFKNNSCETFGENVS
jgi:hypothetical protein